MKTLAQFYPFVEPEVMGCPHPVIDHYLRLAIREFCQRGRAWKEWVDAFSADGTTNQFDYDLVSGQELVKVTRALRNDDPLTVMSVDQLPSDWQTGTSADLSDAIVHYDAASFMVFPLPDSGDVLRLEMLFQPSITATQVGDVLFDTYADQIAMGVKGRLKAMLGKPWADATLAGAYLSGFDAEINRAANADFAMRDATARRSKPVQPANWSVR